MHHDCSVNISIITNTPHIPIQVRCDVDLVERCQVTEEACHTAYKRECRITYRPSMTKVKVKVCPGGRVKYMGRSLRHGDEDKGVDEVIEEGDKR